MRPVGVEGKGGGRGGGGGRETGRDGGFKREGRRGRAGERWRRGTGNGKRGGGGRWGVHMKQGAEFSGPSVVNFQGLNNQWKAPRYKRNELPPSLPPSLGEQCLEIELKHPQQTTCA